MKITDCNNVNDFRKLAKKKLPSPIFHYIDGAADDEVTYRRNTQAYDDCFLVPKVLRSVESINQGINLFGKKISLPFFFLLQHFRDYFIIKVNLPLQKQRKNIILFLEFHLYQQYL